MSNIAVESGDTIRYGESLGQQDNLGLNRPAGVGMHVHIEMDTGHYQQFQNYMDDLANGRLPVQARYRENVEPLPVVDDGTFRLRSEEHTSELQSLMRISYAVFCLKKKKQHNSKQSMQSYSKYT